MIMSGTRDATIRSVQVVDIHGTRLYNLSYSHDDAPERVQTTRIGTESVYTNPQSGDHVQLTYVMNVVVSVSKRP